MTSPREVDRKGNELLVFQPGQEADLEQLDARIPLPLSLVVGRHQGETLLVFNKWRQEWELPGDMIDPGETPHAAACASSSRKQVIRRRRCNTSAS